MQAKMQWLQYPNQNNVVNVNNVRREASRLFRNKKKEYLNAKIEEVENNGKIKNSGGLFRSINYFNKGYQPRTVIVMDENDDWFADSYSILARWRNYFSQLLNYMGLMMLDRQTDRNTYIRTTSSFEVEMAIEKLKDTNHQELIKSQQN